MNGIEIWNGTDNRSCWRMVKERRKGLVEWRPLREFENRDRHLTTFPDVADYIRLRLHVPTVDA